MWKLETLIEQYHVDSKTMDLRGCSMSVAYDNGQEDRLSLNLSLVEGESAVVGSSQGGEMLLVLSFMQQ